MLAAWPAVVFIANFAILDLADYWRHRLSHRYGWWYGIHSLHHAEEQMTFGLMTGRTYWKMRLLMCGSSLWV